MEWTREWLHGEVLHSGLELLDRLLQSILCAFGGDFRLISAEDDWKQVQSGAYQFLLLYLDQAISVSYEGNGKSDTIVLFARNYTHWNGKLQYTVSAFRPATALLDQFAAFQLASLLKSRVFAPVPPLAGLPVNCLATILAFLSPADCKRLSLSSFGLYMTLQSQSLWQLTYILRFGDPMFALKAVDWRTAYSHQVQVPS